jgi:hypothetical protein
MLSRKLQEEKNPVDGATGVRFTRRSADGILRIAISTAL